MSRKGRKASVSYSPRHRDGEKLPRVEPQRHSSARGRQGCGGCASGRAATVARGRGPRWRASRGVGDRRRSAPAVARPRCCSRAHPLRRDGRGAGGDGAHGRGRRERDDRRNEAAFFHFTLAPYEDAVLTLTMLDGDADVYVLGPSYSRQTGPGRDRRAPSPLTRTTSGTTTTSTGTTRPGRVTSPRGRTRCCTSPAAMIRFGWAFDTSRTFRVGVGDGPMGRTSRGSRVVVSSSERRSR